MPPSVPRVIIQSADGGENDADRSKGVSGTAGDDLPPRLPRSAAPVGSRTGSRSGSMTGEPESPPLTRAGSHGSGAVTPTILDITESWLQVLYAIVD